MKHYYASLQNNQGCIFDRKTFTNVKEMREWAGYRGGDYSLLVMTDPVQDPKIFRVRNGRVDFKES